MPDAIKLMGINPRNQLVPLRLDDKGRLELVQVQSGDEAAPEVTVTLDSLPAVSGSITANPTRPTLLAQALLSGADATIYTAAANWRDVVIYVKNVDTEARTCQLALGATATDTTSLVKSLPLEVGARVPICVPALASTQVLRGLCDSANKVSVEIWGTAA
jgi:hypothetical protein